MRNPPDQRGPVAVAAALAFCLFALPAAAPAAAREVDAAPPVAEAAGAGHGQKPEAQKSGAQKPEGQTPEPRAAQATQRPPTTPPNPLPPPSVTRHTINLPQGALAFTATAGAIRLVDAQSGAPQADVAYVSYVREATDAARPVVFALNGGPGAASGWLNLGALGPFLLDLGPGPYAPSARPALVPNPDGWLDFADLVFIDPPLTGYSRLFAKDEARRRFLSVDGDVAALAVVMRKWLNENGRTRSPVFIVGESYGGFRAPKLARALQDDEGIGVDGLILISPVLDFGWIEAQDSPLPAAAMLPSLAAAARGLKPTDTAALAEIEAYASGPYLADLLRAPRDPAVMDRLAADVSRLTGLDPDLARRSGGRIDPSEFARERERAQGRLLSRYDLDVSGLDPTPRERGGRAADPVLDATKTAFAAAMAELTARELGWKVDARYEILNGSLSGQWRWDGGRGSAQAIGDLRQALALDPSLRVLIVHGLTDAVTPYFASKLLIAQLPPLGDPGRVALKVYEGGHMPWLVASARAALRQDARALIEAR
ncbi:S10 family peptidase [Methylocella sp.]|uniref:S10 family peptidase n=1 Tax=Methylocella sp. TaxID=1978226 RepID=UPI0037840E4F